VNFGLQTAKNGTGISTDRAAIRQGIATHSSITKWTRTSW